MRCKRLVWFAFALALLGCGASFTLKRPIERQCARARLVDCGDLTDGILTYVTGDENGAIEKMRGAVHANEPERLKEFAGALLTLSSLPGAKTYAGPVKKVAAFLTPPANQPLQSASRPARLAKQSHREATEDTSSVATAPAEATGEENGKGEAGEEDPFRGPAVTETPKSQAPSAGRAARGPVADPFADQQVAPPRSPAKPTRSVGDSLSLSDPTLDPSRGEGATLVPSSDRGALPCHVGVGVPLYGTQNLGPDGLPSIAANCLIAASGPMVVTDLHTTGACQTDIFVLGGPARSRWLLLSPARTALHLTGARLAVQEGESLTVAITSSKASRGDIRCSVTWGGVRQVLPTLSRDR